MSMSTLKDVAREAGVSIATVSLFLNGKPVSKIAQESIASAIERIGYTPRRARKKEGSNLIGILIEQLGFPAFSDILYFQVMQGFEQEARRHGFHTVITSIDTSTDLVIPDVLANGEFAGIVAMGGGDLPDDFLHTIAATGLPMVLVDNYFVDGSISSIVPDNEMGAYFGTRHLIDQGLDPIAVITGPSKYKTLTDRLQGFLRAMVEAGCYPEPWQIQPSISKGVPNKGYLEMKTLLSRPIRPRAVFCISDRAAFGAYSAIQEAGLQIPRDIALVGFDDVPEGLRANPPLTTIHMPKYEMGIEAARKLVQIISRAPENRDFPVKITLPTYLVQRASC